MKKIIITFVSVLLVALMLTACSNKEEKKSTDDSKYPTANNTIEGKNQTEQCYNMDMSSFTEQFNKLYKEKTDSEGPVIDIDGNYHPLDKDNWQVVGDKKQKDGETSYTAYSQNTEKAEIILSIDDTTKKIITFSTATTNGVWKKSANDVKAIAIIGSIVLGDYGIKTYDFFNDLFDTAISGMCYYDNVAYRISGTNYNKKAEDDMVIKLMSIPTTVHALRVTAYTDYKMYKEGKCDFGQHTEKTTVSETTKKADAK